MRTKKTKKTKNINVDFTFHLFLKSRTMDASSLGRPVEGHQYGRPRGCPPNAAVMRDSRIITSAVVSSSWKPITLFVVRSFVRSTSNQTTHGWRVVS